MDCDTEEIHIDVHLAAGLHWNFYSEKKGRKFRAVVKVFRRVKIYFLIDTINTTTAGITYFKHGYNFPHSHTTQCTAIDKTSRLVRTSTKCTT